MREGGKSELDTVGKILFLGFLKLVVSLSYHFERVITVIFKTH